MSSEDGNDTRAILQARARKLAEEVDGKARGRDLAQYLCFAVGQERLAIDLSRVAAFWADEAIIPVPDAPPAVRGLVLHEGAVLAVVDVAALFGGSATRGGRASVVALGAPHEDLAIAVTEEQGIVSIERPERTAKAGFVSFTLEDGRSVLDIEALGDDPRTSFTRRMGAVAPRKE